MSKSKGNVIAPDKVLKQYGSEILRLWVAMSDYQSDLKISDDILKQTAEQYRKLRNTFRIMLANVNDLEAILPFNELGILDQWIVSKAQIVFDEVHRLFGSYNFVQGMSLLNNFIVNELSGIYIDVTKDRLYCDARDDAHRRGSQSAIAMIAKSLLTLIAPILTYTADEILENAPKVIKGDAASVFDLKHEAIDVRISMFHETYMRIAREKFSEIVDMLKKEKKIKSTLELVLSTASEKISELPVVEAEDWFVVSAVGSDAVDEEAGRFEVEGDTFVIGYAQRHKCPRCWKLHSFVEDEACPRCTKVLNA